MLATMDVVTMPHWWQAKRLLSRLEKSEHGRLFGAAFPSMGDEFHQPWDPPPKNTFVGNFFRRDGWGNMSNPRRLFALMAWQDHDELARFEAGNPWPQNAVEHFHTVLRPVRSHGEVLGSNPMGEEIERARGNEHHPGIVITWANFPGKYVPHFLPVLRTAVEGNHRTDGALASWGAVRRNNPRRFKGFTVSLWRTLGEGANFAYRHESHREALDWFHSHPAASESWFGRFVLEQRTGTVAGRDPFEGIEPAPPAAEPEPALAEGAVG
jgi:hypothetical protein